VMRFKPLYEGAWQVRKTGLSKTPLSILGRHLMSLPLLVFLERAYIGIFEIFLQAFFSAGEIAMISGRSEEDRRPPPVPAITPCARSIFLGDRSCAPRPGRKNVS